MKFVPFLIAAFIMLTATINALDILTSSKAEVNLTHWRNHRRNKRFIIFQNTGVCKFVTGIAYPVDLADKKPWRQLVLTYNFHYQFPLPRRPIYWWNKWSTRNLPDRPGVLRAPANLQSYKDDAQEFIYEFAEKLMEHWGMNGRACVQRLICENAQVHINQGLYAEILHRLLQPQRNLKADYTEAWRLGRQGVDCQVIYPKATKCLLDDYIHEREDFQQQNIVKVRARTIFI